MQFDDQMPISETYSSIIPNYHLLLIVYALSREVEMAFQIQTPTSLDRGVISIVLQYLYIQTYK